MKVFQTIRSLVTYFTGTSFRNVSSLLVSSTFTVAQGEGYSTTSCNNNGAGSYPGAGSGPSGVTASIPGLPTRGSLANAPM